jgi:hypothetical protein
MKSRGSRNYSGLLTACGGSPFMRWVQGLQPAAANPAPIQNLLRTAGGSEDSTREAPDALVHALFFEDTNRTTKEVAMLVDELLHKIFQKRL